MINRIIPVILDSTIFKQIPQLDSEFFKLLRKYVRIKKIAIYIPLIIEKEYLSWIDEKVSITVNKINDSINALDRILPKEEVFGMSIISSIAENQLVDVKTKVIDRWNKFKEETHAEVMEINEKHAKRVMESYFNGDLPFRSKKSREDIPDAFIYQSVMELSEKNDLIVFITHDKLLKAKMINPKIKLFDDLSEMFVERDFIVRADAFTDSGKIDRTKKIIEFYKEEIIEKINKGITLCNEIGDIENEYSEKIIGDLQYISSETKNTKIDNSSLIPIEENIYLLSFTVTLEVEINYVMSRNEIMYYDEGRIKKLKEKDEDDDGNYRITEDFYVFMTGKCSMVIEDSDPAFWKQPINEIEVKVDIIDEYYPIEVSS